MVHPWLLLPINDVFSARGGRYGLKTISRWIYCNNDNLYASTERQNIGHRCNVMTVSFLREARGRPYAGTTPMHRRSNRADGNPWYGQRHPAIAVVDVHFIICDIPVNILPTIRISLPAIITVTSSCWHISVRSDIVEGGCEIEEEFIVKRGAASTIWIWFVRGCTVQKNLSAINKCTTVTRVRRVWTCLQTCCPTKRFMNTRLLLIHFI